MLRLLLTLNHLPQFRAKRTVQRCGNVRFDCFLKLKVQNVIKDLISVDGHCGFFFYCRNTLTPHTRIHLFLMSLVTLSARPPQQIHIKVDGSNILFQPFFTDSLQICATFYFEKQTEDQQENTQSCVCVLMCVCVFCVYF